MSQTKLFLKSLIYISLSPHHIVAVFRSHREVSIGEAHADIGKQDEPVGLCCGWGATCCCYDLSKMSEESDKLILLSDSNGKIYNNGQVYSNGTNAKYTTSHKFLKYDVSADVTLLFLIIGRLINLFYHILSIYVYKMDFFNNNLINWAPSG